jgi:hypothetical protein
MGDFAATCAGQAALLSLLALQACNATSQAVSNASNQHKESSMSTQSLLAGPLDALDVQQMPVVVPVSDAQTAYVVRVVASLLGVVSGTRKLEEAERELLGQGEFFVPKDRTKPHGVVRLYPQQNFAMSFVSASLTRRHANAAWSAASLTVQPKNAPIGLYQLGLPGTLFEKLRRVSVLLEDRPANGKAPAHRVRVFIYSSLEGEAEVQLTIECREDACSGEAPFPTTFQSLKISRVS